MSKSRRAAPSEHAEQCAVIDWWAHACKSYGLPQFALIAIPNGAVLAGDARRRAMQMHRLKAEGLRAGVPDLFLAKPIPYPGKLAAGCLIPGLWIEMKRKPNKPSTEQETVILYLRQRSYHVVITWSADEAIKAIKAYLAWLP